jgi:hypothetical protein
MRLYLDEKRDLLSLLRHHETDSALDRRTGHRTGWGDTTEITSAVGGEMIELEDGTIGGPR